MAGLFNRNFSPARPVSPLMRNTSDILSESQYLQELLTERQKLAPFMPVLPICTHLLNQELRRVSGLLPNHFGEFEDLHRRSPSPNPMASPCHISNNGMIGWNGNMNPEFLGLPHGMIMDLDAAELSPHSFPVKKIVRLDIPIDAYPTFNFVGRLLGPRGNSLKRVEAQTGCRVYIRGQGSIKDPEKEEKLKGKPGYEHLKDPLHILIEAELPKNIVDMKMRQAQEIIEELLKPVDESQDAYKRQQLRELALLNSSEKEDGLQRSTSASSFSNNGTVQANGGQNDKFTITAIE